LAQRLWVSLRSTHSIPRYLPVRANPRSAQCYCPIAVKHSPCTVSLKSTLTITSQALASIVILISTLTQTRPAQILVVTAIYVATVMVSASTAASTIYYLILTTSTLYYLQTRTTTRSEFHTLTATISATIAAQTQVTGQAPPPPALPPVTRYLTRTGIETNIVYLGTVYQTTG
jgi:hypothetical protein